LQSRSGSGRILSRRKERAIALPEGSPKYYWEQYRVAFSLLPLAPGSRRKTLMEVIVPDSVWTLDQIQGIVNVNVPVRSVVVKLQKGGLFVYNPVAPTPEVITFMRSLEAQHGPVKHIVLGSLGLEHKALCGPFTRFFNRANVWLQPGQWSFPLDLPTFFFGFPFGKRLRDLPDLAAGEANPFEDDFDYRVLGPLKFKSVGGFGESAFFHRKSSTLLVTDTIISVQDTPPAIIEEDPRALLFHSRDEMLDDVKDTDEARLRGWRRMVLFGLIFFPSGISVSSVFEVFAKLANVSEKAKILGQGAIPFDGGLYPWSWTKKEEQNFKALQGGLLVAPILTKLILNREPGKVLDWVDQVASWPVKRIIPSHFANNIKATSKDFNNAFNFLRQGQAAKLGPAPKKEDLALLDAVSDIFSKLGIVAPPVAVA